MLNKLTLKKAIDGLGKKEFSSLELTKACLNRIEGVEGKINAFVTVTEKVALAEAEKADALIKEQAANRDKPLLGIPIAIKDNFSTKGVKTTASSKLLADYIPPYDATVVKKLKDAGAIIIGKTNMDAWAHGSSTETSDFGTTRNPWNTDHLPGGSSGGSAAAVAAGEAIAAIGSETAGSIRQPASWCGVVGLKPTYGRVSRYGVVAMASSLDSPGPITKTVEDSAIILKILAGRDDFDATTSPLPVGEYTLPVGLASIKNLRIGISDDYFIDGIDSEVESSVKKAIARLEKLGAKIETIKLFDPKYAIDVYTIIQRSEVSSNLARYDEIRYGNDRSFFGEEAKRRIMLGTYALSAGYYDEYYNKASKVRSLIIDDFKKAYEKVDLIIAPTSPSLPLPLGSSKESAMFGEIADVLVEPSSIAGLTGISIPVAFSRSGLPIGMQIIGPQFAEELVLRVAHGYEQSTLEEKWRKKEPIL